MLEGGVDGGCAGADGAAGGEDGGVFGGGAGRGRRAGAGHCVRDRHRQDGQPNRLDPGAHPPALVALPPLPSHADPDRAPADPAHPAAHSQPALSAALPARPLPRRLQMGLPVHTDRVAGPAGRRGVFVGQLGHARGRGCGRWPCCRGVGRGLWGGVCQADVGRR